MNILMLICLKLHEIDKSCKYQISKRILKIKEKNSLIKVYKSAFIAEMKYIIDIMNSNQNIIL